MNKGFISLDWGTTSFRASEIDGTGNVVNQHTSADGILSVQNGQFAQKLETLIGSWSKSLPIIASGMITSRQGWVECEYVECPAGCDELARAITSRSTPTGREVHFLTGLHYHSPTITHDVMRGEETQVIGSLEAGATHFITPGTHSKWIATRQGKIRSFSTHMTGEAFALFKNHSILGRLMQEAPQDDATFRQGVSKAFENPGNLLHQLFATRTHGLFNIVPPEKLASYLSGLLIGSEVTNASESANKNARFSILATPALARNYVIALEMAGRIVSIGDPNCATKGQSLIAKKAGIL